MLRSVTLTSLRRVKPTRSFSLVVQHISRSFISTPSNGNNDHNKMDSKTKQGQQQQSFTTQTKGSDDVRHSLLQATLAHVPEHGWTMESISQGAAELGFPSVVHGVFPGGPAGLVDTYLEDCQQRFVQLMASGPEQYWHPNASMTDKVRALTVLRLNMLKPYARRWPEAVSILAVPSNLPMAMHHLSQVVDDIWYYAGDRSPDMNWYTKRVSLATIYSATELYMSQDISPEYVETYRFLDRRLNQAEWLDATSRQLGTMLSFGARSLMGAIAQRGGHSS